MGIRSKLAAGVLASTLSLGGGVALAQEATPEDNMPEPLVVHMMSPDGEIVANATFSDSEEGVNIMLESTEEGAAAGIEPGMHGFHIHETGACVPTDDPPFDSAGGHFNPTDAEHGALEDEDSHAGDLGNIEVMEDGSFSADITTDKISIEPGGENSLDDEDGSAIMIHSGEDDLESDPSGESGDRIACGVIFDAEGMGATPAATPES